MRLATIDCGTNTVLLLVAEVGDDGVIRPLADRLAFTRLGQGLDRTGRLSEEAMARTIAALKAHDQDARALGAERVLCIGTESLRAAENGAEFLRRAAAAGVPVRVVSGDEEARLSFRSVVAGVPPGPRSVLDIGGGSTELIVGDTGQAEAWRSVPIGSVRLTERHLHSDPPTAAERQALRQEIVRAITGLPAPRGELWGVAGTVTTLGAMHLQMAEYDGRRIEGLRMEAAALAALVERLAAAPLHERRQMPGLDPRRADVIYAGAEILLQVALRAGVAEFRISDRGVRYGALAELAEESRTTRQDIHT
jgi:exopolyphosphatase/guanosine-5'-triphosphate,3'-diphosphate pyrophosphatase